MNRLFRKGLPIFIIGILITISCADDPLKVGIELLPDEDRFEAISDTLAIKCLTSDVRRSGFSTSTSSETDNCPIGHVIDPLFGETWAQLFTYFARGSNLYVYDSLSPSDVLEECVIYLNFTGTETYGDTLGFDVLAHPLTMPVTYGSEASSPTTSYLIKSDLFPFNENPISDSTAFISNDPEEQIPVLDSGSYIAVWLNNQYGKRLMDSSLTSTSEYLGNFPGLYLYGQARPGTTGGINNFYYNNSKLVLKYKRPNGTEDGLRDTFLFAYHNLTNYQGFYKHDYNNATIKDVIDRETESANFYLQSMDGLNGEIDLVELDSFRAANMNEIGINLAELVFPMTPTADTNSFFYPKRISVYNIERDNLYGYYTPDDARTDNPFYYNGYYDSETKEYRINLTETIHEFMQGDWDQDKFYLSIANYDFGNVSSSDYKNPSRLVLNSGNHPTKPAYLRLIYTLTNY